MSGDFEIVEGWTGDLDFQLNADGSPQNLTGMTVELILKKSDGEPIDTAGDVSVFDAVEGKVRYSPDPAELQSGASPLTVRWKVTDGVGKIVYWPSGAAATIHVHPI